MSRTEKLLAEARLFEGEFTAAQLTVNAWVTDPFAFGLRGFEKRYPDSKIVAVELARKKGVLARGVVRVRPGVYRYAGGAAR